jgi:hypothetical protein
VTTVTALADNLAEILAVLMVEPETAGAVALAEGYERTMNDDPNRNARRSEPVTQLHRERSRLFPISSEVLRAILERHLTWVASGWELGQCAHLQRADLHGADLREAHLQDADLNQACLQRADLAGADLRGADLRGADLTGANLEGADLTATDLSGANLARARGLTQAQVDAAFCDASTVIPPGLKIKEALQKAN